MRCRRSSPASRSRSAARSSAARQPARASSWSIERACNRLGWPLADQRCVVQGFGNVGGVAARDLAARGAKVLAVSDISGGVYDPEGLDVLAASEWAEHGSLDGFADGRARLELGAARAAVRRARARGLEDQITAENAGRIDAKMVAEGANGPTTFEADAILADRGLLVLPDVLTNAGGVTVSYFEWVQDLGRLFWDARGDPRATRRQAQRTPSTACGSSPKIRADAAQRGERRRHPRGRGRTGVSRDLSVTLVREAMITDPRVCDGGRDGPGGRRGAARPEVRAVFVCDEGRLVGVVTRKTLVREVVAPGRDPAATPLAEIAEEPHWTIDADSPSRSRSG